MVDGTNRNDRRDSTGPDLLRQSKLPERPCTEEVEISSEGSQKSAVRILSKNHAFSILKRDGKMRSPPLEITRGLAALLKESPYVINALREEEILVLLLK